MSKPSFELNLKRLEEHIRHLIQQPVMEFQEINHCSIGGIKLEMTRVVDRVNCIEKVEVQYTQKSPEPEPVENMEGCPFNHAMGWDLDGFPECEMCAKHHYCRRI